MNISSLIFNLSATNVKIPFLSVYHYSAFLAPKTSKEYRPSLHHEFCINNPIRTSYFKTMQMLMSSIGKRRIPKWKETTLTKEISSCYPPTTEQQKSFPLILEHNPPCWLRFAHFLFYNIFVASLLLPLLDWSRSFIKNPATTAILALAYLKNAIEIVNFHRLQYINTIVRCSVAQPTFNLMKFLGTHSLKKIENATWSVEYV